MQEPAPLGCTAAHNAALLMSMALPTSPAQLLPLLPLPLSLSRCHNPLAGLITADFQIAMFETCVHGTSTLIGPVIEWFLERGHACPSPGQKLFNHAQSEFVPQRCDLCAGLCSRRQDSQMLRGAHPWGEPPLHRPMILLRGDGTNCYHAKTAFSTFILRASVPHRSSHKALDKCSFVAMHHKTGCHLRLCVTLNSLSKAASGTGRIGRTQFSGEYCCTSPRPEWPSMVLNIVLGTAVWWTDSIDGALWAID